MSTDLEVELTFLASELPLEMQNVEPQVIKDVYVDSGNGSWILRLRKKDNYFELTKKAKVDLNDHSLHEETSIEISENEYNVLSSSSSLVIDKKRYKVVIGSDIAEVDVFEGRLKGLVVIDFEFPSIIKRDAFVAPEFCLYDATQDKELSAGLLAGKSYDEMQEWLSSKGYEKIL